MRYIKTPAMMRAQARLEQSRASREPTPAPVPSRATRPLSADAGRSRTEPATGPGEQTPERDRLDAFAQLVDDLQCPPPALMLEGSVQLPNGTDTDAR